MGRIGVFLAAVSVWLLATSAHGVDRVLLKQEVKIPYAMQSDSKVVKPGKYVVEIGVEGAQRILTLYSPKGQGVLRTVGERKESLKADPSLGEGKFRLTIMRLPDTKSPGKHSIVFMCDENFRGKFYRMVFRVPEAAE